MRKVHGVQVVWDSHMRASPVALSPGPSSDAIYSEEITNARARTSRPHPTRILPHEQSGGAGRGKNRSRKSRKKWVFMEPPRFPTSAGRNGLCRWDPAPGVAPAFWVTREDTVQPREPLKADPEEEAGHTGK